MRVPAVVLLAALAACAPLPEPAAPAPAVDGLLPGSIGALAASEPAGVVVTELRPGGAAFAAGLRAGDVVVRYNGVAVFSLREFNRLVTDSPPGSLAQIEVRRGGTAHHVTVPVRELDTMPRV
jgi:S1-C subfamily serine protease